MVADAELSRVRGPSSRRLPQVATDAIRDPIGRPAYLAKAVDFGAADPWNKHDVQSDGSVESVSTERSSLRSNEVFDGDAAEGEDGTTQEEDPSKPLLADAGEESPSKLVYSNDSGPTRDAVPGSIAVRSTSDQLRQACRRGAKHFVLAGSMISHALISGNNPGGWKRATELAQTSLSICQLRVRGTGHGTHCGG